MSEERDKRSPNEHRQPIGVKDEVHPLVRLSNIPLPMIGDQSDLADERLSYTDPESDHR
jgi:hypothetical protein